MDNREIAAAFGLLARLMELYDENPFKIRSYQNASITINRMSEQLSSLTEDEIQDIPGVGKAISSKIKELLTEGRMNALDRYKDTTPEGIIELIQIKGIGVKKVRTVWEELKIESIGELLYACNEHRLVELKGFGSKTQESIQRQLEYYLRNRSKFLYAFLEPYAIEIRSTLQELFPGSMISFTGDFRRAMPVLDKVELLISGVDQWERLEEIKDLELLDRDERIITACYKGQIPLNIHKSSAEEFGTRLLQTTGPDSFLRLFSNVPVKKEEREVFEDLGKPWVEAEGRDLDPQLWALEKEIVNENDIRGVIHCHTRYSDGVNSIPEMVTDAREMGYEYLGISDHSQIAVYADGMKEEELLRQWDEIDRINKTLVNFRILKGIECDILADGALDYETSLLEKMDFVIASIHTVLKMDKNRATERIIKAVEHPRTNILGHPTGRILLGREGYPLDFIKIFDACRSNQVAVELNANPYRLDIPWTQIPLATNRQVMISINPDAHRRQGIKDIKYGILCGRKGWLPRENVLNARGINEFLDFCRKN